MLGGARGDHWQYHGRNGSSNHSVSSRASSWCPFLPSTLSYSSLSIPSIALPPLDHEVAALPHTKRVDNDFSTGDEEQIAGHMLRSALVSGLSSSGSEIPWTCSTGNCTFPEVYNALSICSACEDLSAEVVVESALTDGDFQNITTSLSPGDNRYYLGTKSSQLNTSFSIPCYSEEHREVARMDMWLPPMLSGDYSLRIDMPVGVTMFSDAGRLISTGQSITGCDTAEVSNTWACRGYGAASCTTSTAGFPSKGTSVMTTRFQKCFQAAGLATSCPF